MLKDYNIDTFYNFIFNSMIEDVSYKTITKETFLKSFLGSHLLEASIEKACDKIIDLLDKELFEKELQKNKINLLTEINNIENVFFKKIDFDYSVDIELATKSLNSNSGFEGRLFVKNDEIKFKLFNNKMYLKYDMEDENILVYNHDKDIYKKIEDYNDKNYEIDYKIDKRPTFNSVKPESSTQQLTIHEYVESLKNEFFYALECQLNKENLNFNPNNIIKNIKNIQNVVKVANEKKYPLKQIFGNDIFKNLLINQSITTNLDSEFQQAIDMTFVAYDLDLKYTLNKELSNKKKLINN